MYYFLLPSSKIRDATFLFNEEGKNVIAIMSSAGYMYTQLMDESSSAQHGPFYVTNVLEITHEDLKVSRTYTCAMELYPENCWTAGSNINFFLCDSRIATGRWPAAVCRSITPMCSRCFSSATARESPSLPQWAAAPPTCRGSSPSMSKGNTSYIPYICFTSVSLYWKCNRKSLPCLISLSLFCPF